MTRFRFFAGKGGVGKTTCAAAAALAWADAHPRGRALVVSTDPAHSLGDALEVKLSAEPRRIALARGRLDAAELDADAALDRWLRARRPTLRLLLERGTYLDEDDVDRFLALSLPGVDELVGLLELARLGREGGYDEVVVDTAPTGHTLRLLAMPKTLRRVALVLDDMQAKHRVIGEALGGALRADAADALVAEIADEASALRALLRDPSRASVSWVSTPEAMAVAETADGLAALAAESIPVDELVVNRVTPPSPGCRLCAGRRDEERRAIAALHKLAPGRRSREIPLLDDEPRGRAPFRIAAKSARSGTRTGTGTGTGTRTRTRTRTGAGTLALAVEDSLRLLLFGGKGGVGKTTCAAAAALTLAAANPGKKILLLSTDPAHSLGDALGVALSDAATAVAPNLWARELDAAAAFRGQRERYRRAVDELFDRLRGGSRFDAAYDRAIVQDLIDLAPPGLDELFAVLTVIDALFPDDAALQQYDLVVVDTAPTGHALRLLELPAAAHEWVRALMQILLKYREVAGLGQLAADLVATARGLRRLEETLADPRRARFVAVTRAAALPLVETERLAARLRRLGVALSAVIVNALTPPACARCAARAAVEKKALRRLAASSALAGCAILAASATAPPPHGAAGLPRWAATWRVARPRAAGKRASESAA